MKPVNRLQWMVTGLMAAFMLMASIPDILQIPQAVSIFRHLGYPAYLLPFLGTAKTLAVVVILMPGLWRLKEWAYAGLVFDLIGALYSHISVGDAPSAWVFPMVGLLLVMGSYALHRRELNDRAPGGAAPPRLAGITGSRRLSRLHRHADAGRQIS